MMKKITLLIIILLVAVGVTGCMEPDSDDVQRQLQEKILKEGTQQTGMPNIHNFFERKTMKKILEMRDNPDLTTYAYTQGMNGKFIYIGRAIGYGLPFGTQFTNPQKLDGNSSSYVTIPQADPNGLFSPEGAEATWLLLVDDQTNEVQIAYSEPRLFIYQKKLPKRLCEEWSLPSNY